MLSDKVTLLIFSCEKFSDLWDAHVEFLEKNWGNRGIETYIVTDEEHEKHYANVKIMPTHTDGLDFPSRLTAALEQVKTEYVFVTLDDYFLIQPVSNEKIAGLVDLMERESLDYLRLFKRPTNATGNEIPGYPNINYVHTDKEYSVNLYAGIWRRDFMKKTVEDVKDIWHFEVALTKVSHKLGAKCAVSHNNEFVILDVVRKGKILIHANRYFKKHNIYVSDRPVHTFWYEFKLGILTWGNRLMPRWVAKIARKVLSKFGFHSFSQEG